MPRSILSGLIDKTLKDSWQTFILANSSRTEKPAHISHLVISIACMGSNARIKRTPVSVVISGTLGKLNTLNGQVRTAAEAATPPIMERKKERLSMSESSLNVSFTLFRRGWKSAEGCLRVISQRTLHFGITRIDSKCFAVLHPDTKSAVHKLLRSHHSV